MKASIKLLIITIVFAFTLLGCGGKKEEEKKEESKNKQTEKVTLSAKSIQEIKLETETVSFQPFTGYLSIPAKVLINQDNEAQIGSLVQGRVHKVFVKVGDFVKAGQILMTIEGLEVGTIKAGFLKASSNLNYTKINYERLKKLFEENIGSQKALLESKAEYDKAQAEYKAEDMKIHAIGLSDDDVTNGKKSDEYTSGVLPIKASINGILVERNVVIGQLVDANTNAFKIINTNNVWIDGQIYEKDITKINQKTEALFTSVTYRDDKFTGKLVYIGQTVDPQTRTITIRGEFNNTNSKLKPQMFGELKIPISTNAKAIMIPEESTVKELEQVYVFVQINDTTFEKRTVITGVSNNNRIEIKDGLKEGEKVVSNGVFYLKSELKKDELTGD